MRYFTCVVFMIRLSRLGQPDWDSDGKSHSDRVWKSRCMSEAPPGAPPSPPRAGREQPRRSDKGAQRPEASAEGTAMASLGAAQRLRAHRSSSYSPPPAGPLSVWDVMKLLGGAIRVLVLSTDEDSVDDGCSIKTQCAPAAFPPPPLPLPRAIPHAPHQHHPGPAQLRGRQRSARGRGLVRPL